MLKNLQRDEGLEKNKEKNAARGIFTTTGMD
jgi:hypothetical protein